MQEGLEQAADLTQQGDLIAGWGIFAIGLSIAGLAPAKPKQKYTLSKAVNRIWKK